MANINKCEKNLKKELSYKEVCAIFQTKESPNGKDRKDQLAKWQRYADIIKIKNKRGKYYIERFYNDEEVQAKHDLLNYLKYLEGNLLNFFVMDAEDGNYYKEGSGLLAYTYKDLRERINMVNNHYFPVKYNQEDLLEENKIKLKFGYSVEKYDEEKKMWFEIVESIDKNAIRKVLKNLQERETIKLIESYKLFYIESGKKSYKDNSLKREARICTAKELSDIQGIMLKVVAEYVELIGPKYKHYSLLTIKKNKGELSGNDLYLLPMNARNEFDSRVKAYIKKLGYNAYGRCFIINPSNIKGCIEYYAPKFNRIQVERFLKLNRFEVITSFIHKQLVEQLIKI